jgi:hypothetical protein
VAVAAYLLVGGLPGMLYAAGICLAGLFGAAAIVAGRTWEAPIAPSRPVDSARLVAAPPQRWHRKDGVIAELRVALASTGTELEEHRHALANLAAQLSRESAAADRVAQQLEQRIRELEAERDGLSELVAEERERFERTLDELGGGIGRHGSALAELERELEALIAR